MGKCAARVLKRSGWTHFIHVHFKSPSKFYLMNYFNLLENHVFPNLNTNQESTLKTLKNASNLASHYNVYEYNF